MPTSTAPRAARLVGAAAAASALVLVSGCSAAAPPKPAYDGVYLLVGVHANEPSPGVPAAVASTLTGAARASVPFTVIAVDGSPRVIYRSGRYTVSSASDAARDDDVNVQVNAVIGAVSHAAARSAGSDLAAAITVASDDAKATATHRPLDLVVDSGISDRGALDMTARGMTGADPADVAAFEVASGQLPPLRGTQVVEVGFGYTAAPQAPLSARQRRAVAEIWRRVLERQGATVSVLPAPRQGAGPSTRLPTGLLAPDPVAVFKPPAAGTRVFGAHSALGFLPGSTRFVDPTGAATQIRAWAAWLVRVPGRTMQVTGTCAGTGTRNSQLALSGARAAAVAAAVRAAGAPRAAVTAEGVGTKFDGYVLDVTSTGALDPVKAQLNRTVRVTLAEL